MQTNQLDFEDLKSIIYKRVRRRIRTKALLSLLLFAALGFILTITLLSKADNLNVISGNIYATKLNGIGSTNQWGGAMGRINYNSVPLTTRPFFARFIDSPNIVYNSLSGGNLKMSEYNLVIMNRNISFNMSLLYNTTSSDLNPGVLFPSSMYNGADDPDKTFDCSSKSIFQINGKNFSACHVNLLQDVNMGLLKYKIDSTHYTPVYIVDTSDYTCYNDSSCNFEFLLPTSSTDPYYYYYVGKFPQYKLKVWIDSQERTDFPQTALPYYLKVQVLNLYTGEEEPNVDVAVSEENGNDLFVPLRFNGIISRSLSVATTNSSGMAEFIIAPTEYPDINNYSIKVGVLIEDKLVNEKDLSVDNDLSIELQKKTLSPSALLDNAKVTVNAMNQIANSLYTWANSVSGSDSPSPEANLLSLTVFTNGSYTPNNLVVQTGAPNVIDVTLKTPSGQVVDGYVKAEEDKGYLVMNPTYNSTSLGYKEHIHNLLWMPTQHQFVITPTSYGSVNSTVNLEVYDSSYAYITTVKLNINPNLEPRSGSSYENDNLKVIINSMAAVLNSLYYALN